MQTQTCTRCVMNNRSDDTITFDENGYCNYCTTALASMDSRYFPNEIGKKKLEELIVKLKEEGKDKKYDCLMGISGGLDSAYLAYLGYKNGLRILAVHIDDGFDTETAIENIKKISKACEMDIVYEKPNREQFINLTKAFLKAGVPNIAIPQDNLIFAYLFKYAKKYNIKYFLSGGNFALESILQRGNTHDAYDKRHIKDINKKFGSSDIDKLPITSNFHKKVYDRIIHNITEIRPLNYIDYNKQMAMNELKNFCGYNYYGGKHYESILTMFMQMYYLPNKFNVDKRTSHLSSLIISGQMTREEACLELEKPLYVGEEMEGLIRKMAGLLNMTKEEFEALMEEEPREHKNYKISKWRYISIINKMLRGF